MDGRPCYSSGMRIQVKRGVPTESGLSQIEVLVLGFGVLLLGALVLLMITRSRALSQSTICKSNLKNIGVGMQLFAGPAREPAALANVTNEVPSELPPSGLERLSKMLQNVREPRLLFVCPTDVEALQPGPAQPAGLTISYFISDEATPPSWSLLAGDRNLTVNGILATSGTLQLKPDSILGWSEKMHRFKGNVALGDGSTQDLDDAQLADYLRRSRGPQMIVIP